MRGLIILGYPSKKSYSDNESTGQGLYCYKERGKLMALDSNFNGMFAVVIIIASSDNVKIAS